MPMMLVLAMLGLSLLRVGAADQLPVVCPAIEIDERKRTNAPMEAARPVELVVVGPCKRIADKDENDASLFEVEVQAVLYGGGVGKTVRFQWWWHVESDVPQVFALAPTAYETQAPWEYRYSLGRGDEAAQRALATARLDYRVLSAQSVFVGREIAANDDYQHAVKVVRVLAGTAPQAGTTIIAGIDGYPRTSGDALRVDAEERIYLVDRIASDPKTGKPHYHVVCRQPVTQEQVIGEALKRRDDHPVVDLDDDGKQIKAREIMFRGSIEAAIDLLGSESHAAVTLGQRMLLHQRAATALPVFTAAERGLFAQVEDAPGAFRRLGNLIEVLHAMGKGGDNRVRDLLERHLAHLAGAPAEPPPLPKGTYLGRDEGACNRALTWLLAEVDDADRLRFGARLLQLRETASPGWKARIQDALDRSNIEDALALLAQLERSRSIQPPRSALGFLPGDRCALAFSPDGGLLATSGDAVRVWDVRTWRKLAEFTADGGVSSARFSPDGNHLHAVGGSREKIVVGRFDWRTGKQVAAFAEHSTFINELAFSADGRVMVTSCHEERRMRLWDAATGKVLRTIELKDYDYDFALSHDGGILARDVGESRWRCESASDGKPLGEELNADFALFSPDGACLVTLKGTNRYTKPSQCLLEVREARAPFALIASRELSSDQTPIDGLFSRLAISADGRRLAIILSPRAREPVSHADEAIAVLSLPDLKPICRGLIPALGQELHLTDLALSADGGIVAVAQGWASPLLFDGTTGAPIVPTPEYQPGITGVRFSADGGTIVTTAKDTVCTWDAQTLRQRTRIALPAGQAVVEARPDGRYILCQEPAKGGAIRVVAADTGQLVCASSIAIDPYRPSVSWDGERELLVFSGDGYRRLDYVAGRVVKEGKLTSSRSAHYLATVDACLLVDFGIKGGRLEFSMLDFVTGKLTTFPDMRMPSFTGNERALVPGDRFYCLADPGFHLIDWRTQQVVASRPMQGVDIHLLEFSPDGSRYVLVSGSSVYIDAELRRSERKAPCVVRVCETLSGKMIFAREGTTGGIRALTFSPDGKRLAVVNEDSTLEIWPIGDG